MSRRIAWLLCLMALSFPALVQAIPSFREVRDAWRPSFGRLLDRHGDLLSQIRLDDEGLRLAWVPLTELSPAMIQATVSAEDRRYFQHHGVDWRAMGGALLNRIQGGSLRGASTISMQLAARLDARISPKGRRRGLLEKIRQMRAALSLEESWSKGEILEAYLNLVDFRGEIRGIGAISAALFRKHPAGLSNDEAVLLAALLPHPGADPERLARRACTIARGSGAGRDCSELSTLAAESLRRQRSGVVTPNLAPQLARQYLRKPGESVSTSIDRGLQETALAALRQQLGGLAGRNVRDGAALVVDNPSGEVLAYVASAGPNSGAAGVDGVRARRQAGSTLKPFLYGLALEKRYLTAASLLNDAPLSLETAAGLYIPQNYERDFKGLVSARTALASSLNIPAVRVLMLLGVEGFRNRLRDFGYLGIREAGEYYGFSLALGSAEVNLLEQVNAYRTLANGGRFSPLRFRSGEQPEPARSVMGEAAAFLVADILADRAGRSLSFGLANPLATRYWTAVKTGTSKDMRDNWCIGFSRRYTVGVWVGNFEGDSMREVSGVSGAAPAWLEIMNALHESEPSLAPPAPEGLVGGPVSFARGLEPERWEWFFPGTETRTTIGIVSGLSAAARIASPANGAVIALDPDIPSAHQAVFFSASPVSPGANFLLDGQVLGAAPEYRWQPRPGSHRLSLVGAGGKPLATVNFSVRMARD